MKRTTVTLCALLITAAPLIAQEPVPIFDAHLHAYPADYFGPPPRGMCTPQTEWPAWDPATPYDSVYMDLEENPPCEDPVWSPETDAEVLGKTLEVMERLNIYGVLSGYDQELQAEWVRAAPGRFIPGAQFDVRVQQLPLDSLQGLIADGRVQVIGEVTSQYTGLKPGDPELEPYWQLAEERDVPVGIHLGLTPPGAMYFMAPNSRATQHSALTLEPVLVRHPNVRVYIMHAGWPMIDDLISLMWAHPQVYVGVGIISYWLPDFESYLKRIVDAGFGNRVMFGSDQMIWPESIERAVRRIEAMDFLTTEQKRDIFYNNAARFFRFTEAEIDRHHGR